MDKEKEETEQLSVMEILEQDCGIKTEDDIKDLISMFAKDAANNLEKIKKIEYTTNEQHELFFIIYSDDTYDQSVRDFGIEIKEITSTNSNKDIKLMTLYVYLGGAPINSLVKFVDFKQIDSYEDTIDKIFREAKSEWTNESESGEKILLFERGNALSSKLNFKRIETKQLYEDKESEK